MSRQTQRQRGAVSVWVAGVLVMVLAGVMVWLYLGQDPDVLDEQRVAELQKSKLPLPAPGTGVGDWPQWRGPNRDGLSSETGLLEQWPEDLATRKVWEAKIGAGYSTVAVDKGRVYGFFQDGESEAVVCWQADTGQELWRYRHPAFYQNGHGNGPRSTPSVASDRLYTVGGTGIMHCLKTHPATPQGEAIWQKDLLTEFGAQNLGWGVSFSPLVVGDLVYTNPGGPDGKSLAALDTLTGAVKWTSQDDTPSYSSPVAATIGGIQQIVFFTGKGVLGVGPEDGRLLWRYPWNTMQDIHAATPIIAGDYVFISSGYSRGCALLQIETAGGQQQAKLVYKNRAMKNHFSSCVLYQDHLYGFNDSRLTCLDFRTGKVKWDQSDFDKGSLTIADGKLIILGENGLLALADATPEGYRQRSKFQFGDNSEKRCWSVPVVGAGRLYVRDQEKLWCVDVRKKG